MASKEWVKKYAGNPCAKNARKTHCIRGHLLPTKPNRRDGSRVCNTCKRQGYPPIDDEAFVRKYFPNAVDRCKREWKQAAEFIRNLYSEVELTAIARKALASPNQQPKQA